ncbi:hypothetical protein C8Q76DRAFT_197888 [Earliella scabrosa]|nr:hypothetical protein C8Q76DRAFT_197888 [Earliella scabrosa]
MDYICRVPSPSACWHDPAFRLSSRILLDPAITHRIPWLAMPQHQRQASTSTMDSPSSARDGAGSVLTTLTAAPAEVNAAAEIIKKMKDSLGTLGSTLDSLGTQTVQMIQGGGEAEIERQIGRVRKRMSEQEQKQEADIADIQALLKEVLEHDIIEHLTTLIEAGIMEEIDALVEEQVALHLPEYVPQELQEELRAHRKELESVQKELHNSESRRANATLRSHKMHEKVHTLFNTKGEVSKNFPGTLGEMFSVSGETAASLVRDYGLGEPSSSRERNINTLMQNWGIQYQLQVSTGPGGPIPCRTLPDRRRDGGL